MGLAGNLVKKTNDMTMLSAVAIGDIFVDYISDLTEPVYRGFIEGISSSTNLFASIDIQIGGAGLQFAAAAKSAGFAKSVLIGKIGGQLNKSQGVAPDLPGEMVMEFLQRHDIQPLLAVDPDSETGRIVIIFLPNDRRLMLSDRLANALFSPADITSDMNAAVRQADLIHISGYTFLQENRRVAVIELIQSAKKGNAKVVLDVVPHNIYKTISFEQMCSYVEGLVDWIIVEIPTAHQLVDLGQLKDVSPELIDYIQGVLQSRFPSVALYLNPGHAIVTDKKERLEYTFDYQPGITSRGHSAETQAKLLFSRFSH
jgi:sugar/nucleoside kinase (ribokinase family)